MSDFLEILDEVFARDEVRLQERQREQFAKYYELLIDWNSRMNLTAIEDAREVAVKHFLDSAVVERVLPRWDV